MSGTVPDIDLGMYEIVDLSKQKSKKRTSSKDGQNLISPIPLYDEEEHEVLTGNLSCKSNENTVEKKSSANVSDLYAKVDLSKKKAKNTGDSKAQQVLSSDVPLYHVTQHNVLTRNLTGRRMENFSNSKPSSTNVSDVYAVVDLSKKKKRRQAEEKVFPKEAATSTQLNDNKRSHFFERDIHNDCIDSLPGKVSYKERGTSPNTCKFCLHFIVLLMNILVVITVVTIAAVSLIKVSNLDMSNREYNEKISILRQNYSNLQKNYVELLKRFYKCNETIISLHDELPSIKSQIENGSTSYHNLYVSRNNISNMIMDLYKYATSQFVDNYLSSCSDISRKNSSYASGSYIVRSSAGVLRSVYCDFNRTFGGNSTGWTRVAEVDVNNCPCGLRHVITNNSVHTCVVKEDNASCTEINYPVYNLSYTQITGQIIGYQVGTSDGFVSVDVPRPTNFTDLNSNYLDGVSISTNGQHVWSFATGCNCHLTQNKPTIIGEDYTCDGVQAAENDYYELLWASQQCGGNATWFHKILPPTTTDIKVRICRDQNREDEDLAIKTLELYIK